MPARSMRGDTSQRVTVPLPQSLNDLETTARKHFGKGGGGIKMYHRGETHIQHHGHFANIRDNDNVVIRQGSIDLSATYPRNMTSTHQSDYVKHPIDMRRPQTPQGPSVKGPAFTGRSCYAGDYIEHRVDPRDRVKPPGPAWQPSEMPMTGRSTYHDNYPWHKQMPERPKPAANNSGPGPAFDGQSSYKLDYVKHQVQPQQRPMRNDVIPDGVPFNGQTTYFNDFKKHAIESPKRTGRQPDRFPSPPFGGTSEYKHQYLEKRMPRGPIVHLEPEKRGSAGSLTSRESRSR